MSFEHCPKLLRCYNVTISNLYHFDIKKLIFFLLNACAFPPQTEVLGNFIFLCVILISPQIGWICSYKNSALSSSMVANLEAFWMKESLDQCRLLFLTVTTLFIQDKLFRFFGWGSTTCVATRAYFYQGPNHGVKGYLLPHCKKEGR